MQSQLPQSQLPQSRKIRWNRLAILVAGVLGVLSVCCAGGVVLAPNLRRIVQATLWKTDTRLAAQAAHEMVDYDLPPNYQELKVLSVQDKAVQVIIANRARPGDMIYLESVQDGIFAEDEWQASYETRLAREMGDRRYNTRASGTQPAAVRGQPAMLRLFEGPDENGRAVRQVVCGFSGKNGDVLLAIVAGQDSWDQAMVDNFIRSIR